MQEIRQQNLLRQLVEFRTNQLISIIANPKAAVGSVSFDSCQSKFNVGKKKAFPSLPFERGPRLLLISNYFVAAFNILLPSEFLFCLFSLVIALIIALIDFHGACGFVYEIIYL